MATFSCRHTHEIFCDTKTVGENIIFLIEALTNDSFADLDNENSIINADIDRQQSSPPPFRIIAGQMEIEAGCIE